MKFLMQKLSKYLLCWDYICIKRYKINMLYLVRIKFLLLKFSNPLRWPGRPDTPPFKWGEEEHVKIPDTQWLVDLNL